MIDFSEKTIEESLATTAGRRLLLSRQDAINHVYDNVQKEYRALKHEVEIEIEEAVVRFSHELKSMSVSEVKQMLLSYDLGFEVCEHQESMLGLKYTKNELKVLDSDRLSFSVLNDFMFLDSIKAKLSNVLPKLINLSNLQKQIFSLKKELKRIGIKLRGSC